MKYMTGNILDLVGRPDAICITTNGYVTSRGQGVMGMGIAKAMSNFIVELPDLLGKAVLKNGHVVQSLVTVGGTALVSFPVKPTKKICVNPMTDVVTHARAKYRANAVIPGFHCVADTNIIRQSCEELMTLMDLMQWRHCVIPIPGCGAGELSYQQQVKAICESHLDDRVWMCSFKEADFLK